MSARGPRWSPLPRGAFSGRDWSPPGAVDGFDPYLAWAEATLLARGAPATLSRELPAIVELAEGRSVADLLRAANVAWLRVPPVYRSATVPPGLRHCTARIGPGFVQACAPGGPLHGIVNRFELGLPVAQGDPGYVHAASVPPPARLRGKVIALIDGGLAFGHESFLHDGRTRIRAFWRQDAIGPGSAPPDIGYGREWTGAYLDDAIARFRDSDGRLDEGALYRAFAMPDLRRRANHGTHVLDLACGKRLRRADAPTRDACDDAATASVVAVQLAWANVLDTSGGAMNVSVLDALHYVLARCAPDASIVVNLSWGTLAGPHDGSSVLECAIDALVERRPGLRIVVPAGNGYQAQAHANATLRQGESMDLRWRVPPDDRTPSFLELWMATPFDRLDIMVTPPGSPESLPPLGPGESGVWADPRTGAPRAFLTFPRAVATGRQGTCALLALAPTFSFDGAATTAPAGVWGVSVRQHGPAPVTVDAFIERDDVALGQNTGARQSRFEDERYDPQAREDTPVPPHRQREATWIRRSGTFNSLATGRHVIAVGGVRERSAGPGAEAAPYSPRTPDPDAARPRRAGVKTAPEAMAASDDDPARPGVRAAGALSGGTVRLVGTSSAAPRVTREVFNSLPPDGATSAPEACDAA